MEITIVKVESGPHRAVVARPGAEAVQFAVYDYGPILPHDLVHYVVEDDIPPQDDPLVAAHVDELLAAEGFVAAFSAFPGTGPEPDLEAGHVAQPVAVGSVFTAVETDQPRPVAPPGP